MLLAGMLLIASLLSSFGQGLGFNYQAMIRNAEGEAIINQNVVMRIGIVQGSVGGTVLYTETHDIESNAYGLVNLVVGTGDVVTGVFADIDWSNGPFFIKVELDAEANNNFVTIGTTQLLSVPFANYAFSGGSGSKAWVDGEEAVTTAKKVGIGTTTPSSYLEVIADQPSKDGTPIFEIKNAEGKTVFAVFDNEVVVYVDDTTTTPAGFAVKSRDDLGNSMDLFTVSPQQTRIYVDESTAKESRGGFAISGRNSNKTLIGDLLTITPTLTEFIVDEPTVKESRGGFAVSGRNSTKVTEDLLLIKPSITEFFVDEPDAKESRGGFAISGRNSTKATDNEIFTVTPSLTEIFIPETINAKESRGGFAISGRNSTKESGLYDIFTVQPERTEIFVKNDPAKDGIPGFSIFGLDDQFGAGELFSVSELGTVVSTALAVAPKVTTGAVISITQTEAYGGGSVTDSSGSTIIEVGIIYNTMGALNLDMTFDDPSVSGLISGDPAFAESFTGLYMNGLGAGVTYQVRAYAINADGATGYGAISTFTTLPPYSVSFNVMTDVSTPIPNATITVNQDFFPYNSTINTEGDYNFELAGGNYWVNVVAQGFYDNGNSITVMSDTIIDVYMTDAPAQLTMNVVDDLGNPVPYASIDFSDGMEGYEYGETDTTGVAKVYLDAGTWSYVIYETSTTLEYSGTVTMETDVDQTVNVTVTSKPTYTVNVTVLQEDGTTPAEGAEVHIMDNMGEKDTKSAKFYDDMVTTGADGVATFYNVPEGYSYDFYAYYELMYTGEIYSVNVDQDLDLTITLYMMVKKDK